MIHEQCLVVFLLFFLKAMEFNILTLEQTLEQIAMVIFHLTAS